jgi:hypothetical protein
MAQAGPISKMAASAFATCSNQTFAKILILKSEPLRLRFFFVINSCGLIENNISLGEGPIQFVKSERDFKNTPYPIS